MFEFEKRCLQDALDAIALAENQQDYNLDQLLRIIENRSMLVANRAKHMRNKVSK